MTISRTSAKRFRSGVGWTAKQKQLFVRACREAGIDEESRLLILRQFDRAMFVRGEGGGVVRSERPTSTSPKLTDEDFERAMAIVERTACGQVLHFSPHYWEGKAVASLDRTRHVALTLAEKLEDEGVLKRGESGHDGLRGWIRSRVARDRRTDELGDLDGDELLALIEGLKAFARRNKVRLIEGVHV